ncbi:YgfZ/GcvT domain-containing protein [Coraliomargarita parva]|uniref:CAF17-like 4Fe-4S cluster assembly/insertion protein YgfZ n=1 Tax=Coraliomargarita parva TaxID=3014050 RepID=UPI0022B38CC3|nr:hypothetical protein [Coraliomargarita parva]
MGKLYVHSFEWAARLRVTDEDAADFLQSQFSNDLRPFEAGQCVYGLWLDVKGKVVADGYVCCEGDESFRIYSLHSPVDRIREKLEHHIIADEVVIEPEPAASGLCLVGEDLPGILDRMGLAIPPAGRFLDRDGLRLLPSRRSGRPACEFVFDCAEDRSAFLGRLQEDPEFVSDEWIQLERVRAGFPAVPAEIGPGDLPGEGGLERDAVSFSKGCFLGQEVVARMQNVGKSQRALFVVEGRGELPVLPMMLVNSAGKTIGELRTAYYNGKAWTGVALLKLRYVVASAHDLDCAGANLRLSGPLRKEPE